VSVDDGSGEVVGATLERFRLAFPVSEDLRPL